VTVNDLMAQLADELAALEPTANEFTAAMFAVRSGKTRKNADNYLNSKVQAGKLARRMGLVNGKNCWLYSAADHGTGI
jgi:predicted transcriptional regulator